MPRKPRRSIDRTLTLTVVLTTGVSLLVACLAFVTYDVITLRRAMTREAETVANLVGLNSAVALAFDDPKTAQETLGALSAAEEVVAAVIYDRWGDAFVSYLADDRRTRHFRTPPVEAEGHRFRNGHLELFRKITFAGDHLGTIYIRSDTRALATRIQRYLAIVLLLLASAIGAGAVSAKRLRRRVAAPLSALAEGSEAIADGDLSTRVTAPSDDEIGVLARTFNAMTVGLRDLVTQARHSIGDVGEVARALRESVGKMSREAQQQGEAIAETTESVEQVTTSIREVSENVDLLAEAARETSDSIMEMDGSITEVASHMDHLASSIETTSGAARLVATSIDEVVQGGDTLKMATDESLMRLHQLSTSVQQVKDNARESQALSEDSSEEASQGMAAVKETITAMGEISTSFGELQESVSRLASKSHSIDEIIQVISGVAEQTSLLSLNATIIAAQAGEHGKAFSVVADQVRNLADRTHRSTRQIAELIRTVQDDTAAAVAAADQGSAKVEKGVQRSHVAGLVLERIIEKSQVSTDRVREIFGATVRQSGDLERADHAMLEVKKIVEHINRSTRDQHQATTEIASAVEKIRTLGERVRTSTDEQRKGSRLITNAVTGVASMISQIAGATQAQTKSSETIQHALKVFRDVSEETTRRAEAIDAMVSTLADRSDQLEQEIGRFKTE